MFLSNLQKQNLRGTKMLWVPTAKKEKSNSPREAHPGLWCPPASSLVRICYKWFMINFQPLFKSGPGILFSLPKGMASVCSWGWAGAVLLFLSLGTLVTQWHVISNLVFFKLLKNEAITIYQINIPSLWPSSKTQKDIFFQPIHELYSFCKN